MRRPALLLFSLLMMSAAHAAPVEIEAAGPNAPLHGTLQEAAATAPMVLIIPGSGPTDRDGNSPLGIKAAPYRLLAEGLAAQEVGSVRIDKRGMFASAAAVPDANAVTIDDYVADSAAWVAAIRQRTSVSCVWLLGHSEGGLVALASAAKVKDVCGLVLVATAGRPLDQVLKEQLRTNPANAPLLAPADKAIDMLKAGNRVDPADLPPPLLRLFATQVQGFLISVFAQDPASLIAGTDKPVLILQGTQDIQVSVADAERLKAAAPSATLTLLPGVNHVLKTVGSDSRPANIATYANPDLPLAPGVVEAVAGFVKRGE